MFLALCIAASFLLTACSEKFASNDEKDYYDYIEKVVGAGEFMPSLDDVGEYTSFDATYKHSRTAFLYELDPWHLPFSLLAETCKRQNVVTALGVGRPSMEPQLLSSLPDFSNLF